MSKLTAKQQEQRRFAALAYARYNASDTLIIAKPLKGVWYYYDVPMKPNIIEQLISSVEDTESDGLKFRFRPTNAVFYKVASLAGVTPKPLASVETVDALVVDIAASTGCRVNRGHAVEQLITEAHRQVWTFNPLQSGWWKVPDLVVDEVRYQIKAYGGSLLECDIRTAIAESDNR